jgi:uncharacterized membrane protein YhiD involved in acid resistance
MGMPDWLLDSLHDSVKLPTTELLLRLAAAFVLGCVSAGVHRLTAHDSRTPGLLGTLVLLSVLMGVLTIVVGNSLARAFSLVGSMAIIRFRSVVEDTRDTAFVMLAVVSGMACGSGYVLAAAAALPFVLLGSWLFRSRLESTSVENTNSLTLRLGTASGAEQKVQALLKEQGFVYRMVSLETVRGGAALDVKFLLSSVDANAALELVAELNRIDGVQGVELRRSDGKA